MPAPLQPDTIIQRCLDAGFALAGVAPATPSRFGEELARWLRAGAHGEMAYLANNNDIRIDPGSIIEGARSVICVADRYWAEDGDSQEHQSDEATAAGDSPRGRIARYARGDDYHVVMKKRLHALCDDLRDDMPGEQFRVCVDTAPILEREIAQLAGVGAVGKHTLLIEPGVGSYLLLGEIVTTLDLAPTPPEQRDVCSSCTRCIDACPTDAITPYAVDARRCISYLTIEHRSPVDTGYFEGMGDWVFGCDICQEVCPHNHPTTRTAHAPIHDAYESRHASFDLLEVLGWDEEDRRSAFMKSALKRAKLEMFKRNALIAAGNALRSADHPTLRQRILEIAADDGEGDLVRQTARDVLKSISLDT